MISLHVNSREVLRGELGELLLAATLLAATLLAAEISHIFLALIGYSTAVRALFVGEHLVQATR